MKKLDVADSKTDPHLQVEHAVLYSINANHNGQKPTPTLGVPAFSYDTVLNHIMGGWNFHFT